MSLLVDIGAVLMGPITVESLTMAVQVAEINIPYDRKPGHLAVRRDTLRPVSYFLENPLSGFTKLGLLGRYSEISIPGFCENAKVICALEEKDESDMLSIIGISTIDMCRILNEKSPQQFPADSFRGITDSLMHDSNYGVDHHRPDHDHSLCKVVVNGARSAMPNRPMNIPSFKRRETPIM